MTLMLQLRCCLTILRMIFTLHGRLPGIGDGNQEAWLPVPAPTGKPGKLLRTSHRGLLGLRTGLISPCMVDGGAIHGENEGQFPFPTQPLTSPYMAKLAGRRKRSTETLCPLLGWDWRRPRKLMSPARVLSEQMLGDAQTLQGTRK